MLLTVTLVDHEQAGTCARPVRRIMGKQSGSLFVYVFMIIE
jgi:hypothetical protein